MFRDFRVTQFRQQFAGYGSGGGSGSGTGTLQKNIYRAEHRLF